MCGIAGVVGFDRPGARLEPRARRLRDRLRHRGPDGEGLAVQKHVALAHTRLALLDAAGGAQPMTSADGRYTLVFNGEIHDHLALRAALDYPFRTRSDTETVLAAFARWGDGAPARLSGMFAFFAWDAELERGVLARDALGVKPAWYALRDGDGADAGEFWFASEAHALARELPRVVADVDALLEVLTAPCFSGVERCAFAGIRALQPGTLLEVSRAGVRERRWYRWPAVAAAVDVDAAALAAQVRARLDHAVRAAAQADAEVGVFLSGGLDSSAILALARTEPHAPGTPRAARAYTIRFEQQQAFDYARSRIVVSDDLPFARLAAESTGASHVEVAVARRDLAADLADLARIDDQVPAWEQQLAQHHLARVAARDVKAVLVGDAADETHFGYHFLLDDGAIADPAAIVARFAPVPIRRAIDADPVARFGRHYRALIEDAGGTSATWRDRVAATTWLIVNRWLPRLLHNGDVHTMAFGLEARVPFVDRALLEVAATVPPELGLAHATEKSLLRAALAGVVPETIRLRRKSALPKDQGAAHVYRQQAARVLDDPHPVVAGLVDFERVRPLLHQPDLDEADRSRLFRVIALHQWAVAHGVHAP